MKAQRLFRTIWRINGALLLLAFVTIAVGAAAGLVSTLLEAGKPAAREETVTEVDGEELALGDAQELEGTPHVLLPLVAHHGSGAYSSGERSTTRNLLFFDGAAGRARWLRPDHRAAITTYLPLHDGGGAQGRSEESAPARPVRWLRYELADADTDGDGQITEEDALRVAVSGAAGDDLTVVLPDAEVIHGYSMPRNGTLLVFFRRGGAELVGEIDLAARELRRTTPLPKS
ncbi:hypothetical protein [Anaeromyxobacter terrae]|uniref:hypothetical protein n=1 Tax=Anaeromyxobacter terrae TaxID=2925406 RepID=UPI001F58AA45|nr:hypothetical protein [Anaeromyxobacter sp. SG22]